jgi:mannose-6-phosphate isomerase-like protein (cupin superfamily)
MDRSPELASLSRRETLGGVGLCLAMLSRKGEATVPIKTKLHIGLAKDSDHEGLVSFAHIHGGKGTGQIKMFPFDGATAPANFLIYDLPPGASEGTHAHFLDNRNQQGSYDEYYYIISGHGQMEVDGRNLTVAQGDHVHTPLEVAHGIENTDPKEHLRVFLTFIKRGNEPDYRP